jgi:hypothetical protein
VAKKRSSRAGKKPQAQFIALVPETWGLDEAQLAELKKALQDAATTVLQRGQTIATVVATVGAPIN